MDIWEYINFDKATRENRENAALWMLDNSEELQQLINSLNSDLNERAVKSAYVLELVAVKNLKVLKPYMPQIAQQISQFKSDSIQRSLLHIMKLWLCSPKALNAMDDELIDTLTQHCFDKLIQQPWAAVAVMAHAMSCLHYLSARGKWVKEPLVDILIKNMPNQSPGYRARAKHIIQELNR